MISPKKFTSSLILENYRSCVNNILPLLRVEHTDYVTNVSHPEMAISLELSSFLWFVCLTTNPKLILDLGSGFSSFIFRYYQKTINPKCVVWSIDDDVNWLERTRDYLMLKNVSTRNLCEWQSFREKSNNLIKANIILLDLAASKQARIDALPNICNYTNRNTLLIMDDLHKPLFHEAAVSYVKSESLKYLDLKDYTLDQYERYSWLMYGFKSRPNLIKK